MRENVFILRNPNLISIQRSQCYCFRETSQRTERGGEGGDIRIKIKLKKEEEEEKIQNGDQRRWETGCLSWILS